MVSTDRESADVPITLPKRTQQLLPKPPDLDDMSFFKSRSPLKTLNSNVISFNTAG